jgi:hypothetical protein
VLRVHADSGTIAHLGSGAMPPADDRIGPRPWVRVRRENTWLTKSVYFDLMNRSGMEENGAGAGS